MVPPQFSEALFWKCSDYVVVWRPPPVRIGTPQVLLLCWTRCARGRRVSDLQECGSKVQVPSMVFRSFGLTASWLIEANIVANRFPKEVGRSSSLGGKRKPTRVDSDLVCYGRIVQQVLCHFPLRVWWWYCSEKQEVRDRQVYLWLQKRIEINFTLLSTFSYRRIKCEAKKKASTRKVIAQ